LQRAIGYFGCGGMGAELIDQNESRLVFQGSGGHVAVTANPGQPPTCKTKMGLETREWDYAVRTFMSKVHESQRPVPLH